MQLSWILLPGPMRMGPTSPRRTAPYQTVTFSPRVTSPMRAALSAARAVGAMAGVFPAAVRMSIDCLLVNTGSAWAGGPVYAFKKQKTPFLILFNGSCC